MRHRPPTTEPGGGVRPRGPDPSQRVALRRDAARAATFQAGPLSASSHEAALLLHRVERIPFHPVVTVPADATTYRYEGIRVHRMVDLRPEHRCVIDGIPTTTLERAIVDVTRGV